MGMHMRVADLREAYIQVNDRLFFGQEHDFVRSGVTAHKFDLVVDIKSAKDPGFHLHDMNYAMAKWRQLCRNYLEPPEFEKMILRLKHYTAKMKSNGYVMDIGMNFKSRDNTSGSCLMGITLGANKTTGWRCHVFSRASELTVRWYADIIFIHVMLREICTELGIDVNKVSIRWHTVSAYQSITSMPWFLVMTEREAWLETQLANLPVGATPNTSWHCATAIRYKKVFLDGGYRSFRVQRRPAEAYEIFKGLREGKGKVYTHELTLPRTKVDFEIAEGEDDE